MVFTMPLHCLGGHLGQSLFYGLVCLRFVRSTTKFDVQCLIFGWSTQHSTGQCSIFVWSIKNSTDRTSIFVCPMNKYHTAIKATPSTTHFCMEDSRSKHWRQRILKNAYSCWSCQCQIPICCPHQRKVCCRFQKKWSHLEVGSGAVSEKNIHQILYSLILVAI